jgi:hypothetical protein
LATDTPACGIADLGASKRRVDGSGVLQARVLKKWSARGTAKSTKKGLATRGWRTVALFASVVDTGTGHEDIVDYGEAAFATYPLAIPREDASIVKNGGLVQEHATTVDGLGEGDLLGVEVVKA